MNRKMTTNSELSTTKPKKNQTRIQTHSARPLEEEQIHRNRYGGLLVGSWKGVMGEKVPWVRSINGR